ncbi:hypothetical protein FQZ97_1242540 [compost metagenome]
MLPEGPACPALGQLRAGLAVVFGQPERVVGKDGQVLVGKVLARIEDGFDAVLLLQQAEELLQCRRQGLGVALAQPLDVHHRG